MEKKVENIIINSLKELCEENEEIVIEKFDADTRIYGNAGNLDSLALVSFIVDLEDKISTEFDKNVTLADEKAMSQRVSPFRSIGTLTDYISKLLGESV